MIVVTNPKDALIKSLVAVYITRSQLETTATTGSVYINAVVRQNKVVTELGNINFIGGVVDNQIITICLDKLNHYQVDAIAKLGVAITYSGNMNRRDSLVSLTNNNSIAVVQGANEYYDKYRLAFINSKLILQQQLVREVVEDYNKLDLYYSYSDDPKVYRSGEDAELGFYDKYLEKGINLISIKTILHAAKLGIINSLNERNETIDVIEYIRSLENK